MATLPMYTVDAFTDEPFAGNPAGVCLIAKQDSVTEELMQKIAAEMNISETAFVTQLDEQSSFSSGSRFGLRWFTPTTEVPLCGHGTLSAAAVLFNCVGNGSTEIHFDTLSGQLTVSRSTGGLIMMSLPENKTISVELECVKGIVQLIFAGSDAKPENVAFSPGTGKLILRMPDTYSRMDLESLQFDVSKLKGVAPVGGIRSGGEARNIKGVIVTVRGGGSRDAGGREYDFLSRYFAPWVGINEDPVTGSAHTVLASYWSSVLGKTSFLARQCSPRGGDLQVTLKENQNESQGQGRVEIAGASTIVLKGQVCVKRCN